MSWDIELVDEEGKLVKIPTHSEGGTYVLGGTNRAELNITYNYSRFYYQVLDKEKGLRWLDGKKAEETVNKLTQAITKLGITKDTDYWAPTPGNAGFALSILLEWAKLHPKATFKVY